MKYDAVIVGSGFGGAFTAYRCIQAGLKTLLIERGQWAHRDDLDWSHHDILIEKRYKSRSPIAVQQYGARKKSNLYPNEVVGGNSVFYGGASLRLRESDFSQWPFDYHELEPFYSCAESLLEVHGQASSDPKEPRRSSDYPGSNPELTSPARRIQTAAVKMGLKPFPIPLAINFDNSERPLCILCTTCDGFPCKIQAKNDVTAMVLRMAQQGGLDIVAGLAACNFVVSHGKVEEVHAIEMDKKCTPVRLQGSLFFLSAGALQSPAIMQRSSLSSTGEEWIGRCLMRHCNAVVAGIFPFRTNPENLFHKQLCFTDFYEHFRGRYGTSTGIIQDIYTPAKEVISTFAPFGVKRIAAGLSRYMQNLLCIAEDDPRSENAVTLTNDRDNFGMQIAHVHHQYGLPDYERRDFLVSKARKVLKAAGAWKTQKYEIDTFSHAVGTVRCGDSPKVSALDRDCRVWGIENLYVVDGSCFPTSGGVNPSLTIAANALRVTNSIVGRQL